MMRSYCKEHDERIVEMYCGECQDVICLLCHALKHCGHNCFHVDEVAEMHRQHMEKDIRVVTSALDRDNVHLDQIGKELENLEHSRKIAKAEIARRAEAMKATIDQQAQQLSANADQLARERSQIIEETRAEVQKSASMKQGFCNYLRQIHKNGTSVDLVRDAEKLHARAKEIDQQATMHDRNQAQYIKFCIKRGAVGSVSLASTDPIKCYYTFNGDSN